MSHQPLADHVEAAKAHLDQHGYCIVENAISRAEAAALRTRLKLVHGCSIGTAPRAPGDAATDLLDHLTYLR